jgi:hypothetical protein
MKRSTVLLAVVLGICAVALGLVSAQPRGVNLYAGIQLPNRSNTVEFYAPAGRTTFTLERVLNAETVFASMPDIRKPVLPAGAQTRLVRRFERRFSDDTYDTLTLGRLPVGVYAIRAVNGRFTTNTMLIVSDLGLVVKRGMDQALTYTADRFRGQPRIARIWRFEQGVKDQAVSNADGLARFGVVRNANPIFLARSGEAWAISGTYWNADASPTIKGYIYTDRPVYRPAQRVLMKGVLRDGKTLRALGNTRVMVSVKDADDQEIYRKTLTTNAVGAFSDGVQLEREPAIGYYRIEARLERGTAESSFGDFYVEAYVKPEYQVTLTPSKARAVQGDRVRVLVDAAYLFGGKVSGGRVNYSVTRAPYYAFEYDGEVYDGSDESRDYGSDLVIQEEARLDQLGQLEILLPLVRDKEGRANSYRIEAQVEDESRRTVAGSTRVIAFPSSISVGVQAESFIGKPRVPFDVNLETKDLSDKGVSASVTVELIWREWVYDRKNGWMTKDESLDLKTVRTGSNGLGRATLVAPRGGGYRIKARVKDGANRVSVDEGFIWILDPGDNWYWNYRELTMRLDKRTYKPGETATLLIGSPKPGTPVLVTLEVDGVRKAEVVRSRAAAISYRIPITPDMSPNVFVGAVMLADENQYEQTTRLRVPDPTTQLQVSIKPDKDRYVPGEQGKLLVSVTDATGKGAPAELGLGVVDEAIYLVRPDTTPNIHTFFHGSRQNAVGTNSSLSFSFESTIVRLRDVVALAGVAPRAPLTIAAFAQNKEESRAAESDQDRVRQDFRDTALWVPNLVTDANGQAVVDVTYPDNLTTYRVTARGMDTRGRAGQGLGKTLVTKDVLTRLILPPFLVRGDTATLSAVVNNNLVNPVTGNLEFTLDGLTRLVGNNKAPSSTVFSVSSSSVWNASQAGFPLNITAQGRTRVDLPVRAETSGTASVTAQSVTNGGRDTIKLPLTVLPRGYRDAIGFAADSSAGAQTFDIPDDANLENAVAKLYLTPSLLSAVSPALEYLLGYPYGCTEQTMSRFLPALLARQTLGANALPESVMNQLPEWQEVGIKRLLDFQHDDGGWGFWTFDESSLEMTAYVLSGLSRAKVLGLKVPNAALDRAVKWLMVAARDTKARADERSSAYRTLAEVGRPDRSGTDTLARRAELEPFALANLAIAYSRIGDAARARDLLDRLKARRKETERGIHWTRTRNPNDWYYYWADNEVQITATALEAVARIEPRSALIPKASSWLLAQRRGPQWISTQDTAAVILSALALPKPTAQEITANVSLNGQSLEAQTLSSTAGTVTLELPREFLELGLNRLEVESSADITYGAEIQFVREPDDLRADRSKGVTVTRKYERLTPVWDKENKRYTYRRDALSRGGKLEPVTVGDLVMVTLTLQADRPSRYTMVSDPLPAGFKALDERSLAISGLQDSTDGFEEWRYWYSGREFRDERVDLYAYYLNGRQVLRYVLRAQTPGTFTALPTRAFLMYDPDVTGLEKAVTLTVRDRGQ